MRNLKGNKLRIGLIVILVVAVFAPTLVQAKDYAVGVYAGDYITYGQITFVWTGKGAEPPFVTYSKDIDLMIIGVFDVVGTTAILDVTAIYDNGTQTTHSLHVDVRSPTGMLYLVASNLTAGDPLSPQTPEFTINQTVTRMYAGANRNVNIMDSKRNITGYSSDSKNIGTKTRASWLNCTRSKQTLPILAYIKKSHSKQSKRIYGQQMLLTSYRTM